MFEYTNNKGSRYKLRTFSANHKICCMNALLKPQSNAIAKGPYFVSSNCQNLKSSVLSQEPFLPAKLNVYALHGKWAALQPLLLFLARSVPEY